MLDLQTLYGRKYRIVLDEAANPRTADASDYELLCKYGKIYVHGPETLAAYSDSSRISKRLESMPLTIHQRGDDEIVVLFAPEQIDAIFAVLKPRRRRTQNSTVAIANLRAKPPIQSAKRG